MQYRTYCHLAARRRAIPWRLKAHAHSFDRHQENRGSEIRPRTLVAMASLKAYFESLPEITRPAPLYCSIAKPNARPKAKCKPHH